MRCNDCEFWSLFKSGWGKCNNTEVLKIYKDIKTHGNSTCSIRITDFEIRRKAEPDKQPIPTVKPADKVKSDIKKPDNSAQKQSSLF